jgi:hypothetical protein
MLESLKGQLGPQDALTLIFDGPEASSKSGFTEAWKEGFQATVKVMVEPAKTGFWGHVIRNKYKESLEPKTNFIMHADDDDTYLPGAFDELRRLCTEPETFYIGRVIYADHPGHVMPSQDETIKVGDFSNQNGIIPWALSGKGTWGYDYAGDFEYYKTLLPHVKKIQYLPTQMYRMGSKKGQRGGKRRRSMRSK